MDIEEEDNLLDIMINTFNDKNSQVKYKRDNILDLDIKIKNKQDEEKYIKNKDYNVLINRLIEKYKESNKEEIIKHKNKFDKSIIETINIIRIKLNKGYIIFNYSRGYEKVYVNSISPKPYFELNYMRIFRGVIARFIDNKSEIKGSYKEHNKIKIQNNDLLYCFIRYITNLLYFYDHSMRYNISNRSKNMLLDLKKELKLNK